MAPHSYHVDSSTDILTAARTALAREATVADTYRGMSASDPKRRGAIQALLEELIAARDPLLPHVRAAGRLAGAGRNPADPIRVTHRELTSAIRRCRSRLAPTSGTRYQRKAADNVGTPSDRRRVAEQAYRSLRGTLNRAEGQELPAALALHQEHREQYGNGDGFKGMSTYRDETRELVDSVNASRMRVRERLDRYEAIVSELRRDARAAAEAGRGSASTLRDAFLKHEERLIDLTARAADFEAAAGTVRALLYREARRRRAIRRRSPRRRADWRFGAAENAVFVFCEQRGRMPTKRECNDLRELPPYTTLVRALGRDPLTQLDRLRNK